MNMKMDKCSIKQEERDTFPYFDLAPIDDAKIDGAYFKALSSAIENDNIYNIAITGIYGSGKSSLLKTFEKNKTKKRHKYINISLSSFCCNKETAEPKEIEKSILQQLFYSADPRHILFSRFRRIQHLPYWSIFSYSVIFTVIAAGLAFLIEPSLIGSFSNRLIAFKQELNLYIVFQKNFADIIGNCIAAVLLLSALAVLSKIFRIILANIKISKVNINRIEIEVGGKNDASVFNKYIDDIIYCFEAEKYDVVVIEDLDRFNNPSIFIKLRELNKLVNSSDKIRRNVKFIYAIKEEFFKDSERTKFFDFILPVIPVINTNNSEAELKKMIRKYSVFDGIRNDFINNISVYISDMRIIKSILNEFSIYRYELLEKNKKKLRFDDEKLFALIVYKNLFPEDFSKLQEGNGEIPDWFSKQDKLVVRIVSNIEAEIIEKDKILSNSKQESLASIDELKIVICYYIGNYFRKKYPGYQDSEYSRITVNGESNNLLLATSVNFNFDSLKPTTNIVWNGNTIKLSDLEKQMNLSPGISDRFFNITTKSKENETQICREIDVLKSRIADMKSKNTSEIIQEYGELDTNENSSNRYRFLMFMIRNGYITEEYRYYISYFREGTLGFSDFQFLLNVKNRMETAYDFHVENPTIVAERLNLSDFNSYTILNYDMFQMLLESRSILQDEDAYYQAMMDQIVGRPTIAFEFIEGFWKHTNDNSGFVFAVCKRQPNLWMQLLFSRKYDAQTLNTFLKDILMYADEIEMPIINEGGSLSNYISKEILFLDLFVSENASVIERIERIIKNIDIHFTDLNIRTNSTELLDYIIKNNYYQISFGLISKILIYEKGGSDLSIIIPNYTTIIQSKFEPLITYVNNNIAKYVDEVLLQITENNDESETDILLLLSLKQLDFPRKEKVLERLKMCLSNLSDIDQSLWNFVVKNNMINVNWKNVFEYFEYIGEITPTLVEFLEDKSNLRYLLKEEIETNKSGENDLSTEPHLAEQNIYDFFIQIAESKDLSASTVYDLCQINPFTINVDDLISTDISENITKLFIENGNFVFSKMRFNDIARNQRSVLIYFVRKHFGEIRMNLDDNADINDILQVDDELMSEILTSKSIIPEEKRKYLSKISERTICESPKTASNICSFLDQFDEPMELKIEFLISVFSTVSDMRQKKMLMINQFQFLSQVQFSSMLILLGKPFNELTSDKTKIRIEESVENRKIVNAYQKLFPDRVSSISATNKINNFQVYMKHI